MARRRPQTDEERIFVCDLFASWASSTSSSSSLLPLYTESIEPLCTNFRVAFTAHRVAEVATAAAASELTEADAASDEILRTISLHMRMKQGPAGQAAFEKWMGDISRSRLTALSFSAQNQRVRNALTLYDGGYPVDVNAAQLAELRVAHERVASALLVESQRSLEQASAYEALQTARKALDPAVSRFTSLAQAAPDSHSAMLLLDLNGRKRGRKVGEDAQQQQDGHAAV